jgi:hypothetical protein
MLLALVFICSIIPCQHESLTQLHSGAAEANSEEAESSEEEEFFKLSGKKDAGLKMPAYREFLSSMLLSPSAMTRVVINPP